MAAGKRGNAWITIAEAAALTGWPVWSARRRIKSMHERNPSLGLLRRANKRVLLVSLEALQRELVTPVTRSAKRQALLDRIEALEREAIALTREYGVLERQARRLKSNGTVMRLTRATSVASEISGTPGTPSRRRSSS